MSHDKKRKAEDDEDEDDEDEDEAEDDENVILIHLSKWAKSNSQYILEVFPRMPEESLTFDRVAVRLPHGSSVKIHYFGGDKYSWGDYCGQCFSFECTVKSVMITGGGNLEIVITQVGGEDDERHPDAMDANFTIVISARGKVLDVPRTTEFLKLLPSKFSGRFPGLQSELDGGDNHGDNENEYLRFLLAPGPVGAVLVEVLRVGPPPALPPPPPPSPPPPKIAPF